ncbi:MAG TPA: hypothetical protein VN408_01395 [Actinoplanes sp.]|nr:hypothetical protein [Actinoplanes sp.]
MDRELTVHLQRFCRDGPEPGPSDRRVSPVLALVAGLLPGCSATVFSRFGSVLLQRGPVVVPFGDHRGYRQVLVDPVDCQVLVVLSTVPG